MLELNPQCIEVGPLRDTMRGCPDGPHRNRDVCVCLFSILPSTVEETAPEAPSSKQKQTLHHATLDFLTTLDFLAFSTVNNKFLVFISYLVSGVWL